jgi:hypothetical protein
MDPRRSRSPRAGGFLLAAAILAGAGGGIVAGQPTIGALAGLAAGLALLATVWLLDRIRA